MHEILDKTGYFVKYIIALGSNIIAGSKKAL
jgi:hypothetical protein